MKKIISVTLALLLFVLAIPSLASCAGADNDTITVITREDGSGTRSAFMELVGIESITKSAEVSQSTTVVMTSVEGNPSAIGYISLGSLNKSVKALKIDGVAATAANVKNGTYKISRPFNIATKGTLSAATADFISFIMSAEGQAVVEKNGYVSVGEGEHYTAKGISGKIVITGSSSVKPVMEKLKEAYVKLNPSVTIELMQSDSSNGMKSVADGLCDIGMASRELKDSEKASGLTPTAIAIDGIAVIVNKECPVSDLTVKQIADVYSGKITKWSEVQK
ncbi:MAG: substrate-binding domain-containing protein [Clostridia bacterium]|nr:substrate-binding domain-containing protein [Clostridia bacterium]